MTINVKISKKPRIGLALGSGAARGLAHIGVLKVLEREKVPIHFIAGTSAGALIGAVYASGVKARQMEEIAN
ncbi:MAG: patatin-like phospholipase family protein [Deltaproteobacteria bacterium]|nr:patatin-like phospholipase family protein [Deltaproteobacteria bacterium]